MNICCRIFFGYTFIENSLRVYAPIIPRHLRPVTSQNKRILRFDEFFQLRGGAPHLQRGPFKRLRIPGRIIYIVPQQYSSLFSPLRLASEKRA